MATTKNKGGRPRRAPGETLERVTLNLRPNLRFGLELLARVRGVSLSQACEYALAKTLRSEQYDGTSILEIADDALSSTDKDGNPIVIHLDSRILAALRLPAELRSPEEKYVLDVYTAVRPKNQVQTVPDFYVLAAECFNLGMSQREATSRLSELIAEYHRERAR